MNPRRKLFFQNILDCNTNLQINVSFRMNGVTEKSLHAFGITFFNYDTLAIEMTPFFSGWY